MKRFASLFLALLLIFAVAAPVTFAAGMEYKETPLDSAWDWYTTLGKSGLEKEKILAQNKAERLQKYSERLAKQMEKDAGNAAADAKKKLGF